MPKTERLYRIFALSHRGGWGRARSAHDWLTTVAILHAHTADSVVRVYLEAPTKGAAPAWEGAALDAPYEEPG